MKNGLMEAKRAPRSSCSKYSVRVEKFKENRNNILFSFINLVPHSPTSSESEPMMVRLII